MKESLENALHDINLVLDSMQDVHGMANATQSMITPGLVNRAAMLRNDIEALLNAHIADHEGR